MRPYLWVTCDPTPLKPKTGSLATLPLFTAPATQNYTWSLATLPTTTRENPARSLATLPTQIGRVTSDHEPHALHTFAFVRPYLTSFYQNFPSPLQPMLSTTFLVSKTFLLSQFSPPSAAHAFNYNIPFIKNITFITISPPSAAHAFNYNIPFIKDILFITIFPPLCSPRFQLQHSFYQKHSFYHNFPPPLQPTLSTTTFLLSKTLLLSQFPPPLQPTT